MTKPQAQRLIRDRRGRALVREIARHGEPRRAFGRADIAGYCRDDRLARPPLPITRYAIERALEAGIRVDAAILLAAADRPRALPPQGEDVAIVPLQQELFAREPPGVIRRRGFRLAPESRLQHGEIHGGLVAESVHGKILPFSQRDFAREVCKRRHVKREDRSGEK
jgi:hypothetical protein